MSTSNTAISLQDSGDYTQQQLDLLINHICKGFSPIETDFFMNVAKRVKLDPFKRQIYAMPRFEGKGQHRKQTMVIMTSIEGLRAIASRCKTAEGSDAYAGNDKPIFAWLPDSDKTRDFPYSAECTVWRIVNGEKRAFTAEVFFDECVQEKQIYENDKPTGKWGPNSMWNQRPKGQLGKCAEAAALRKGFPEETSGLYIDEEGPTAEDIHNSKQEAPKPTSTPVRQEEGHTHDADAEVLPPEGFTHNENREITHWSHLVENDLWKDIKLDEPFPGMTVLAVSTDPEKLTVAFKHVAANTVQRYALQASQWAKIERFIAASGTNVQEVEELLRKANVLQPDESIMDYPGHKMVTLHKAVQKAVRDNKSPQGS